MKNRTGKYFIPFNDARNPPAPIIPGSEIVSWVEDGKQVTNEAILAENFGELYVVTDRPLTREEMGTKTIKDGQLVDIDNQVLVDRARTAALNLAKGAFSQALNTCGFHEDKAKRLALSASLAGKPAPEYWVKWETACKHIEEQYEQAKAAIYNETDLAAIKAMTWSFKSQVEV